MKTVEIQLFEFDELSEDAKAKVLQDHRDINVDYEWHEWTLKDWNEKLESLGFNNPEISFRGFWSQGDGASFVCKSIDVLQFLKSQKALSRFPATVKALRDEDVELEASVYRIDHHYSHEYTVSVEVDVSHYHDEDDTDKYIKTERESGEIREFIKDVVRELSRKIYRELEQEYDHLVSDEAVIDTIEANEYTFRANGKMENL